MHAPYSQLVIVMDRCFFGIFLHLVLTYDRLFLLSCWLQVCLPLTGVVGSTEKLHSLLCAACEEDGKPYSCTTTLMSAQVTLPFPPSCPPSPPLSHSAPPRFPQTKRRLTFLFPQISDLYAILDAAKVTPLIATHYMTCLQGDQGADTSCLNCYPKHISLYQRVHLFCSCGAVGLPKLVTNCCRWFDGIVNYSIMANSTCTPFPGHCRVIV